jgi:hypothetical protein
MAIRGGVKGRVVSADDLIDRQDWLFMVCSNSRAPERIRMTTSHLKVVGDVPTTDPELSGQFFLIVADDDHGVFSVEGPMTDDGPWRSAARHARDNLHRHVSCGPSGPDRNALAGNFQRAKKYAGVPPGGIVRPRQ